MAVESCRVDGLEHCAQERTRRNLFQTVRQDMTVRFRTETHIPCQGPMINVIIEHMFYLTYLPRQFLEGCLWRTSSLDEWESLVCKPRCND